MSHFDSCVGKIGTRCRCFISKIMTTNFSSVPLGAVSSRGSAIGVPLRSGSHSRVRQAVKPVAIAAPERLEFLDKAEEARLQETDAFAELKALSQRQSVNRPQKVRHVHKIDAWTSNTKQKSVYFDILYHE